MQLSRHFHLSEAVRSQTAIAQGIYNIPSDEIIENLKVSALGMEMVRKLLGNPISPTSWFRSPALNTAVGGTPTSDHPKGYAVDFNCTAFGSVDEQFVAIKNSPIPYDQLIIEKVGGKEWIHISFSPELRGQALEITD